MGLVGIGKRFSGKYKTLSGKSISGHFLSIPDTSRVTNFLSARRYFRTAPDTTLIPGDILIAGPDKYICAEHGVGYYKVPIYIHFKMFKVDQQLEHSRKVTTIDAITGLESTQSTHPLGIVNLSIQPDKYVEDKTTPAIDSHIAVCDSTSIQVNDTIGPYIVYKVDNMLGVSVLSIRKV